MATAQEPPPQQLQLQMTTAGRTAPTTVITIAIVAFFVLVVFCVLADQWRRSSTDGDEGGPGSSLRRRNRRGLGPAALAALPIVPYAEVRKHRSGELECAVCLAAFEDGEELRLLPQCSHAFHPDCIDPWLESHVTCPLCLADLEKPAPVAVAAAPPGARPEAIVAVPVVVDIDDEEEERKEEAAELERLRCARRAARCARRGARMPRSSSTGHSPPTAAVETTPGDYERFTVRLPPHVRAELIRSRRLRHATSLVGRLRAQSCEESLACGGGGRSGGGSLNGAKRRWPSFLARTA